MNKQPLSVVARCCLVMLLLLSVCCALGVVFSPHSAQLPSGDSLASPSMRHWLGTDDLGVDLFSQLVTGFFASISLGVIAAVIAFFLGGVLGVLAGLGGRCVDAVISFWIQLFLSVPQLPMMVVVGAFFGQSRWNLILVVALFSWAPIAQLLRARVKAICGRGYLVMAKQYGGSPWYLFSRHMRLEVLPLLSIHALGVIGKAVVQESSLAYLGLSDPLSCSWGMTIAKCTAFPGIYFTRYWHWWLLPPVVALVVTVVCLRLLSRELEINWGRGF